VERADGLRAVIRVHAPYLIGICGPSGSGKSVLAGILAPRLPAEVLALDAYYRDLTHLPSSLRGSRNFDHPDAIDLDLLLSQVAALAAGTAVERPIYDFSSHTRRTERRQVTPRRYLIVEGLFTMHWPELLRSFSLTVYLDVDDTLCLARRLDRDVRERGRNAADVRRQFERTVRPMCERFVRPKRSAADLVLAGELAVEQAEERVLGRVRQDSSAPD